MLARTSPVLKILNEKVCTLNLSPEEKRLYESRMKLKSDIVSVCESHFNRGVKEGIEKGREEGIEKGIEKGAHAKAIETARNCLNLNMPIKTIEQITGLTQEEIEKLK